MSSRRRSLPILVWGGLAATVTGISVAYIWSLGGGGGSTLPVFGRVPDFALTNQLAQPVSLNDFKGRIWIADIVFTRCAGPCPKLTRQMQEVGGRLADVEALRLVSLTADPNFDQPEVLRRYGRDYDARPERWTFLTGDKREIYDLATKGLKLAAFEKEESERQDPNDLFVHSTVFTLVDGKGQLRGFYEALEPGSTRRLIEAVRELEAEGK